jgi:single-strand DNA-binding protein
LSSTVTVAFVGNLVDDPELRYTPSGVAVVKFGVAVNERRLNRETEKWEDTNVSFYRVSAWRQLAENIAQSLGKGARVVVTGVQRQRTYEKDGQTQYVWEITADAVGPDLAYATATVQKMARGGAGRDDPWATEGETFREEPVSAGAQF